MFRPNSDTWFFEFFRDCVSVKKMYSGDQKRIAMLLLHDSKTAEELARQLGIPLLQMMSDLKELLRLGVVEKSSGFPTRYALKQNIAEEVKRRKELSEKDSNALRVRATIEGQAVDSSVLSTQMTKLAEAIKKDLNLQVYDLTQAPVLKEEDSYSTFLELNVSIKNFKTLVRFLYLYGPTTVEVISDSKISFSADDVQDGLHDMSQWIHRYAETLTRFMNRAELEALNKELLD